MLVLSRKEGEQLLIGDNIVLTINRLSGNRVAIGIEAPKEVRVVRGELRTPEKASESTNGQTVAFSQSDSSLQNRCRAENPNWAPISMLANHQNVSVASQADR